MTQSKDTWWRPVALLMLVFAIGMDLLVWQLSGGVKISMIVEQVINGFILAFSGTSLVLLVMSLGSVHQHAQWKEQIFGLLVLTVIGFYAAFHLYDGASEYIREGGVILLSGLTAMLTSIGLVFGLLLALVTGREHFTDPLLEMESTGGDVDIEANE